VSDNEVGDRLLTARMAGEYLGWKEGTIRNKAYRKEIPSLKLGKALRFRKSDLDRWIASQNETRAA
jgi:excisionase family DNA binding protein